MAVWRYEEYELIKVVVAFISRAVHPKLEATKIEISESDDDLESYALTRVSREETFRN